MTVAVPATLYFHGWPGSASELGSFGRPAELAARSWHVVDRTLAATGAARFAALAQRIGQLHPSGPLRLVGFSLGAAAALRVAPYLAERVERIDLVSPAAPLALGDFLPGMAGAAVFRAAIAGRWPFAILTRVQALAARIAPERMAAALMAKAQGGDARLAEDSDFRAALAHSLRYSLIEARHDYASEIMLYVADWRGELGRVSQPVTIWQGTADDWTPPAMAQALVSHLPECAGIRWCEGASHFSTLRAYLEAEAR